MLEQTVYNRKQSNYTNMAYNLYAIVYLIE